jgi:Fur family ferric uptake transcriptional regulator
MQLCALAVHHLVCKNCGEAVEIEGGVIEKWAKMIGEEY